MDIFSERWRWIRRTRRKAMSVAAVVGLITGLAAIGMLTIPANAETVTGTFELDGNTFDDPAVPADPPAAPWDWTRFFTAAGARIEAMPAGFSNSGFDADTTFPDLSTFTSGSKDTLDVSKWSCSNSNNLGGKFDILNAYSAIYEVQEDSDTLDEGDQLLFFGIERAATEGDGNMGFWFLKDASADCEKTGGGKAPAFTGNHSDGDIFVVAGFSNGGTTVSVTAYEWEGGATGALSTTPFVATNQACGTGGAAVDACGVVNGQTLSNAANNTTKPWASPDKNGGDLDVNAFYEGFVRVPEAQTSGCFSTFVANTRSSTSPTATIMDFSRGELPTCRPSTSLAASPAAATPLVTVVGDTVTYTFTETNDGTAPLTNVYLTEDHASCTLSPTNVAVLAPGDSVEFTCSFASTVEGLTEVTAIGHGTSPLGDVTYCDLPGNEVNECDEGEIHDGDEKATAKSVAISPGTEMTISKNAGDVKQGDTVTFTFTEKNDGTAPTGYTGSLDLTSVGVSTDSTACNTTLARTNPAAGSSDVTLSQNEVWTYTCTVVAPADDFTVVATGTGTVLAGTPHARVVTYSQNAATPPVSTCVNAPASTTGGVTTVGKWCDTEERVSLAVVVISPSTSLDVTATAVITYTFKETNDSLDAPLTPPTPTSRESVIAVSEATACNDTALVWVSSSLNDDLILDPQETWTFTCKGTLAGPAGDNVTGTATSSATGVGQGKDSTSTPKNVTYCGTATAAATSETGKICDPDERDKVSVSITYQPRGANPA